MERYNPFSDTEPSFLASSSTSYSRSSGLSAKQKSQEAADETAERLLEAKRSLLAKSGNKDGDNNNNSKTIESVSIVTPSGYSTSFPDPFEVDTLRRQYATRDTSQPFKAKTIDATGGGGGIPSASSAQVSLASQSVDHPSSQSGPSSSLRHQNSAISGGSFRQARQQGKALGSFLSRATSVTSSSVTDRVSEAVGSARSALDSLSSQISQAVPMGQLNSELQQQVASKLSFGSASSLQAQNSLPVISRQRVILILDSPQVVGGNQASALDWSQEFSAYHRLTSGGSSSSVSQSVLGSLFSGSTSGQPVEGSDLIEQADFRQVSVLANQSSSTASVLIRLPSGRFDGGNLLSSPIGGSLSRNAFSAFTSASQTTVASSQLGGGGGGNASSQTGYKLVRPEYVVIRQRASDDREASQHLRGIVHALNYCLIPMFEPIEVWSAFQDRNFVFSKLLRVQKTLGKESFPLIPQIFCQTHLDLQHYVSSSAISFPCLIRLDSLGTGKVKIESQQMLRDFVSVLASSKLSCTIEPYLSAKCDLVVQKLGTSLKLFKRNLQQSQAGLAYSASGDQTPLGGPIDPQQHQQQLLYSSPVRRTSNPPSSPQIGSTSSGQQQVQASFERLAEVSKRYRTWVEAISREFDNKIEALSVKIVVSANDDREYIVGLTNCCTRFLGSPANQEEDRRSFVELVITNMNTMFPKNANSSSNEANSSGTALNSRMKDSDKRKFNSQLDMSYQQDETAIATAGQTCRTGQLAGRSQSVSGNEASPLESDRHSASREVARRRGSERPNQDGVRELADGEASQQQQRPNNGHSRQASIGQSLFDQTSTALSSLQRQSMSLLKRLDSSKATGGDFAGSMQAETSPLSAKSDRSAPSQQRSSLTGGAVTQSIAASGSSSAGASSNSSFFKSRELPPKPPPPKASSLINRQRSLTSSASSSGVIQSQQRSSFHGGSITNRMQTAAPTHNGEQRPKVVRQNSALSAFQAFDNQAYASGGGGGSSADGAKQRQERHQQPAARPLADGPQRIANYDTTSITSAGSSSGTGGEPSTAAEDTMNNLKRTFASIFGEKCD